MNRRENFEVERLDRRWERASAREMRHARRENLAARARSLILADVSELPEDERPAYAELLCAAVRAQLVAHHGEPSAANILAREAHMASRNILPGINARQVAERLFAQADDGGAA